MPRSEAAAASRPPIVVPLLGFSDGDDSKAPSHPFDKTDDTIYREKLAVAYMKETGQYDGGRKYILESLPTNYVVYARTRDNNTRTDRYLYGHPSGKAYTSPAQFLPHFWYLMTNDGAVSGQCQCTLCESTIRAQDNRRAKRATGARGIPDVYALIKERLKAGENIDEPIVQPENLKWLATHEALRRYLTELPQIHSFLPRAGELVLYYPRADGELKWDGEKRQYRFWDAQGACFSHAPQWIAGVVALVPPKDESITINDLDAVPLEESTTGPGEEQTEKSWQEDRRRSLEGEALPAVVQPSKPSPSYKVEWFPNPTSEDKDFSWRSEYVPLGHLRPFRYFGQILGGTARTEWHRTVSNAITAMATCAVTDKFHVRGAWPTVEFRCRGVWLGSELIVVGDTIDVVGTGSGPTPSTMTVQAMVIHQTYGEGGREGHAELRVTGESSAAPGQPLTVLLPDVIGRFHGLEAQRAWFGDAVDAADQAETMDQARQISAREDSRRRDRCPWYLADDRIEQLGLTRFNSKAVGRAEPAPFSARQLERTLSVIRRMSA